MPSYWERRAEETRRRRFAQAAGVAPSVLVSEDEAAQERLRAQYGERSLFPGSGTGVVRTSSPVEQAEARARLRDFVLGPERRSVFGGEAGPTERVIRDWGLSEQEFRTAGERAGEGRLGAAAGWAGLGLAGAIPFFGDVAQAAARAGRAVESAADVAQAAGRAEIPTEVFANTVSDVSNTSRRSGRRRNPIAGVEELEVRGVQVPLFNEKYSDFFNDSAFELGQQISKPELVSVIDRQYRLGPGDYQSVFDLQKDIASLGKPITREIDAMSDWTYFGHQPIQNYFREGFVPSARQQKNDFSYYYTNEFSNQWDSVGKSMELDDTELLRRFEKNAFNSIGFLERFLKSHDSHPDFISYRGVEEKSLNASFGEDFIQAARGVFGDPESLIGLRWGDNAFTATSLSPSTAKTFARPEGVIFRYDIPDGVGALPVSQYLESYGPYFRREYEVLVDRNLNFEIVGVSTPEMIHKAMLDLGKSSFIFDYVPIIDVRVSK